MAVGIPYFEVIDLDAVTFNALVDVVVRHENARKIEMLGLVRCAVNGDKKTTDELIKLWSNKSKTQAAGKKNVSNLVHDLKSLKLLK